MALHFVKGNSPLGTLGSLAFFGGTLMGNPFLTSLGSGMTAMNKIMNGNNDKDTHSAFEDAIKGLKGWINPASGNIAKPGDYSHVLDYLRQYGGV